MRTVYLNAAYFPAVELLSAVATAVILLYGGNQVIDGERVTIGVLAAFVFYLQSFFDPIQQLSQLYTTYQAGHGGARQDLRAARRGARPGDAPGRGRAAARARRDRASTTCRFSYGGEDAGARATRRPRTCRRGRRSRWSAPPAPASRRFAKLVARFYDPDHGRVLIDGHDLRDVTEHSLRSQLGIVPQEGFLFSGTSATTSRFGRPDATDEEMREAAQAVGAHEFIERLPDGYDTEVGERGGQLSAGQRQLVAFARAAAADPRILILDEATSNVDVHTEAQIERGPAPPAGRAARRS